ncbi:TetR family transcriptional regulator [Bermanella marisrubri]|uniref:Transcriptional regulator, TetR family protein n=2 Tax=Bermanella marisrubri TaxID=207949 RepID=Q1N1R9_9GAMM|nr:transcriptional regulator, TetR family protein [Oceanobacter sp. RED65] [Bermanella marisrubri]QIZ85776.1 TetR family transcriptional regulator [Bermanella marisrubri]
MDKPKVGRIRERNSQQIIQAAQEEFVLHGFKGTSMQSIADRAGLPKANIHYYFKNKENLYNAVLEDIIEDWNVVLSDMDENSDPKEVLTNFIRNKMQLSYKKPKASKIFAMEIIQGAPHIKEYISKELRIWVKERVQIMQSWIDQGKMRAVDPMHLIFMIWATTQHYADFNTQILEVMNRREYDDEEIERITEFLTTMILNGLDIQ